MTTTVKWCKHLASRVLLVALIGYLQFDSRSQTCAQKLEDPREPRLQLSAAEKRDARLLAHLEDYVVLHDLHEHQVLRRVLQGDSESQNQEFINFDLEAFDQHVEISLQRHHNLFSQDFAVYSYSHNEQRVERRQKQEQELPSCIYFSKDAVFSFCANQIRGRIIVSNSETKRPAEDWHVEPLLASPGKHVIYRGRQLTEKIAGYVEERDPLDPTSEHQHRSRSQRAIPSEFETPGDLRRLANANGCNGYGQGNGNAYGLSNCANATTSSPSTSPSANPTDVPTLSPVTIYDGCYEENTKLTGTSLASAMASSVYNSSEACQSYCQDTTDCQYWTFFDGRTSSPTKFWCKLWSDVTSSTDSAAYTSGPRVCTLSPTLSPNTVSFAPSVAPTQAPVTYISGCYEYDTKLAGTVISTEIRNVLYNSTEACQEYCQETSTCVYWAYLPLGASGNYWCKLYSTVTNTISSSGYISGPKNCTTQPTPSPVVSTVAPTQAPVTFVSGCYEDDTKFAGDLVTYEYQSSIYDSVDACQTFCQESTSCYYWTFFDGRATSDRYWCKLWSSQTNITEGSVGFTSGPKNCTTQPTPSPVVSTVAPTQAPVTFVSGCYEDDTKFAGDLVTYEYQSSIYDSVDACQTFCQESTSCYYWTFFDGRATSDRYWCKLWSSQTNITDGSVGFTSGPKNCTTTSISEVYVDGCHEASTKFQGQLLRWEYMNDSYGDSDACQDYCQSLSSCNYWSFFNGRSLTGRYWCKLWISITSTSTSLGFTSGPKNCTEDSTTQPTAKPTTSASSENSIEQGESADGNDDDDLVDTGDSYDDVKVDNTGASVAPNGCGLTTSNSELYVVGYGNYSSGNSSSSRSATLSLTRSASAGSASTRSTSTNSTHYVRVLLVTDARMHQVYDDENVLLSVAAYLLGLVEEIYRGFPSSQVIQIQVAGILVINETAPWPNMFSSTGESIEVNNLLTNFTAWIANYKDVLPSYDLTQLLTGYDLYSTSSGPSVIGIAYTSTVCNSYYKTSITEADFLATQYVANTMAHELMHGLGAQHTNVESPSSTTCASSSHNYVMDSVTSTGKPEWSNCTLEWFENLLDTMSNQNCMQVSSVSDSTNSEAVCGNGVVEEDEECDCLFNDCTAAGDPCCDGSTCMLQTNATCSVLSDGCCSPDTCTARLASEQYVCRAARDDSGCDSDEVCDGTSASCPEDEFADTGTSCTLSEGSESGACYRGECQSRVFQCEIRGYFGGVCNTDSCDFLRCRRTDGKCYNIAPVPVLDGTPCDSGHCYQGSCEGSISDVKDGTAETTISTRSSDGKTTETTITCFDGVQNGDETDVDCGGDSCLPCVGGQTCESDSDCYYMLECNTTSKICFDNLPVGVTSLSNNSSSISWRKLIIIASVVAAIGGAILVLLVYLCCCDATLRDRLCPCMGSCYSCDRAVNGAAIDNTSLPRQNSLRLSSQASFDVESPSTHLTMENANTSSEDAEKWDRYSDKATSPHFRCLVS